MKFRIVDKTKYIEDEFGTEEEAVDFIALRPSVRTTMEDLVVIGVNDDGEIVTLLDGGELELTVDEGYDPW